MCDIKTCDGAVVAKITNDGTDLHVCADHDKLIRIGAHVVIPT